MKLPGRRQLELAALSGGERSLVATALIMALLHVRQSPFCVLDEVDAALDDANVGRFCRQLHKLSEVSQILVITHNAITVESAAAIYGVTMHEDGVSRPSLTVAKRCRGQWGERPPRHERPGSDREGALRKVASTGTSMTAGRPRRRWTALLARTPRRPLGTHGRVPLAQRRGPESRTASPRAWLLLSVIAAGAVAFSLMLTVIGNPVQGVDELLSEAQFIVAPESEAASTGELLVPRAEDSRAVRATVPALLGLARAAAEAAAAAADFRVVFDEDFSETVEEGLVSQQAPEAGSLYDTTEPLRATLSLGRPQAAVPSVVGLPAAAAPRST